MPQTPPLLSIPDPTALYGKPPGGGLVRKAVSYTIATSDGIVLGDATSGPVTFTLPDARSFEGAITVKALQTNTNLVTLATVASQTIEGASTLTLGTVASGAPYSAVTLVSDTQNWRAI